ncbi:MAG TPA: hypothetical protein VK503_10945 [Candidatus Bathyarchaeia archaeon]|nr:hypothetical protein [Candidatus Bathyarchaeia archaeon]
MGTWIRATGSTSIPVGQAIWVTRLNPLLSGPRRVRSILEIGLIIPRSPNGYDTDRCVTRCQSHGGTEDDDRKEISTGAVKLQLSWA